VSRAESRVSHSGMVFRCRSSQGQCPLRRREARQCLSAAAARTRPTASDLRYCMGACVHVCACVRACIVHA
jgi:hypothetical protein